MKKLKQARGIPTKLFLMKHSPAPSRQLGIVSEQLQSNGSWKIPPTCSRCLWQAQHQKRYPSALEADLQGKSDNIGVCAFIDTRTVKRMCGTYMQEHATNMMFAANIISEDRTGFEHSICEMVKGQRK